MLGFVSAFEASPFKKIQKNIKFQKLKKKKNHNGCFPFISI